jgi:hypothetical protein
LFLAASATGHFASVVYLETSASYWIYW